MNINSSKTFFIGFLVMLILFSQIRLCFGHSGDILSSWAVITPTIDGVISAVEWIDADVADFTLSYCSESHDVTLFVKNDDIFLYLAVIVKDEEYSNLAEMYHDFSNFYFDNDNDGNTDIRDDGLAIRFDNTIFKDTYNPTGVNGWSYSDTTEGGTNDIDGAVTHTNPVPDGVGDYTFEYRHPLNTIDNIHDFSLSAGDTVGFRFSFPDGETTCQPVGYNWPSSSPTSYGDIIIASEAHLKLLFVPLNWTDTQAAFDSQVDTQINFFINAIPLNACPEEVSITKLDVTTQNYSGFACGTDTIQDFVTELGINTADFDIIVGMVENSPCGNTAGQSNGVDTIWVETHYDSVAAHEIGHIYDLEDEYCSNPAGSIDCRCNDGDMGGCGDAGWDGAATGDINYLHAECGTHPCDCPPDGSDDCSGSPCCNTSYWSDCDEVDYGICCRGNYNSSGGIAIMSYANAEDRFPGVRDYDEHSKAHLASLPDLNCHSPQQPLSGRVIDLSLDIYKDDTVTENKIILSYGRHTRYYQKGKAYKLAVFDQSGKMIWSQAFNIYFDYNGPVYEDIDYSNIKFISFPFSYRIPYKRDMFKLKLFHWDRVIFSKILNFCNRNYECDTTETYLTCPMDCPLDEKDKICITRNEGICDPDCIKGVDPDCEGECGNDVCNINENYSTCPLDCLSGGYDGYCDREKDERCDPDCKEEEDPDSKSKCGDDICSSCINAIDQYACENFKNCPADCHSGGKDYYCDKKRDGICDPDCKEEKDPDCQEEGPSIPVTTFPFGNIGFTTPLSYQGGFVGVFTGPSLLSTGFFGGISGPSISQAGFISGFSGTTLAGPGFPGGTGLLVKPTVHSIYQSGPFGGISGPFLFGTGFSGGITGPSLFSARFVGGISEPFISQAGFIGGFSGTTLVGPEFLGGPAVPYLYQPGLIGGYPDPLFIK